MKYSIYIVLISIILFSCTKKEKDFDSFEYSYCGTFSTFFSIKFKQNDTIFLREHWNSGGNKDIKFPKSERNYFALLTEKQKQELSNLLSKINFRKINSEYFEDYNDGSAFQIIFRKGNFKKKVLVHSYHIPRELDSLSHWIYKTKMKLKLNEISQKLEFESAKELFPPPPPPLPVMK
ncbi:hypothetical protein [Flavobacterium cerinum]|uniref:Lipoprotein n=1 Tax=Flavobacterium cerinum TaxID=2502784 RepID=A0ABY5IUW2_9FLAO|nr:hypothetical protein [Flavobacterium cerinum]UUC45124.1 hypothetical protein NOX80_16055 [Flavobacterium cerinum]